MTTSLTHEEMYSWWDNAAKANAMQAILSAKDTWNEKEFFDSGDVWLQDVERFATAAFLSLRGDVAMDIGCGMGRMTHALAKNYSKVIGFDISDEMIRLAKKRQKPGLEFIQVPQPPLPLADKSVDLSFSTIVIQHISPPFNLRMVDEMFRVSRKLVIFDAPCNKLRPQDPDPSGGIFLIDFGEVLTRAASRGFHLIALRNFPATAFLHHQYYFSSAD